MSGDRLIVLQARAEAHMLRARSPAIADHQPQAAREIAYYKR